MTYGELYATVPYYEDVQIRMGLVIMRSKAAAPCHCFIVTEWFVRRPGTTRFNERAVCGPGCHNHVKAAKDAPSWFSRV